MVMGRSAKLACGWASAVQNDCGVKQVSNSSFTRKVQTESARLMECVETRSPRSWGESFQYKTVRQTQAGRGDGMQTPSPQPSSCLLSTPLDETWWVRHVFDTPSGSGPSGSQVTCCFSILGRRAPSRSALWGEKCFWAHPEAELEDPGGCQR